MESGVSRNGDGEAASVVDGKVREKGRRAVLRWSGVVARGGGGGRLERREGCAKVEGNEAPKTKAVCQKRESCR